MAEKAKKTTKKDNATELMSKTISNLTDVVTKSHEMSESGLANL